MPDRYQVVAATYDGPRQKPDSAPQKTQLIRAEKPTHCRRHDPKKQGSVIYATAADGTSQKFLDLDPRTRGILVLDIAQQKIARAGSKPKRV